VTSRDLEECFEAYRDLAGRADKAFEQVRSQYPALVVCKQGCNDCCFAIFEMNPVEAVYLSRMFSSNLARKQKREVARKAKKLSLRLKEISQKLNAFEHDAGSHDRMIALSKERLECPLHSEGTCILYESRPITCRTYGIPRSIRGKGATCGRSGFEPGASYPTLNMDVIDQRLQELSRGVIQAMAKVDPGGKRILIPVTDAVTCDLDDRYFLRRLNL